MAKGINMVGKFRGKVGAMVFRTEAGIGQIASEYNPNPKNPRTLAQTRQRSKMNLAGQISKTVSREMLVGLDNNGRKARSMFVSNILEACRVNDRTGTGVETYLDTMIEAGQIRFSNGVKTPLSVTKSYNSSTGKVSVNIAGNPDRNVMAVRVIALVTVHNRYQYAIMKDVNLLNQTSVNVELEVPATAISEDQEHSGVHVYTIPIVDNGSAAATVYKDTVANDIDTEMSPVAAETLQVLTSRTIARQAGLVESNYEGFVLTDAA